MTCVAAQPGCQRGPYAVQLTSDTHRCEGQAQLLPLENQQGQRYPQEQRSWRVGLKRYYTMRSVALPSLGLLTYILHTCVYVISQHKSIAILK